jgi:AsmA protein
VLSGDLTVGEVDLRAWLEQRGLPVPRTADVETFRRLSLSADWSLEDERLSTRDLLLRVDQTEISGSLARVATSPPGYRFDLAVDVLDLDRYLPPPGQTRPGPDKTSKESAREEKSETLPAPTPVEIGSASADRVQSETRAVSTPATDSARDPVPAATLGDLDLDGKVRVSELTAARLRFGDVFLHVRSQDGSLGVDNQVQRFYQGRLDGRLGIEVAGTEPRISLVQRAAAVQIGPMLEDLAGVGELTGRGELAMDLVATGRNADARKRTLAGKLSIHVARGAVKGFNLERSVREAEARLRGKPLPTGLPNRTDFSDLRASGDIQGGVLTNRDLTATADYLRITGQGSVDLVRERLDYRFEPLFVDPPKGRGIKELEGIPVPVYLTGPFDHPRWNVDVGSALRAVAERQLRERGGGLFKKLEERTGIKGLEQGLRGLFGR